MKDEDFFIINANHEEIKKYEGLRSKIMFCMKKVERRYEILPAGMLPRWHFIIHFIILPIPKKNPGGQDPSCLRSANSVAKQYLQAGKKKKKTNIEMLACITYCSVFGGGDKTNCHKL